MLKNELRVDPSVVPQICLRGGGRMPAVGMGTFGSDAVSPAEVAAAVRTAIGMGYRHVDCAMVYGNEKEIGRVFRSVIDDGLPRDELFVTSKLWNDKHAPEDVIPACERSIDDLGVEYLDLYLIHWPFPNTHEPNCTVESRARNAKPYIHEDYMLVWRELEKLVMSGRVRQIGASNMTIPKMRLLMRDAVIPPAAVELELHPHFQQKELLAYLKDVGIAPIGYCPLGSPGRPERDRTPEDTVDLDDSVVRGIASSRGIHPAELAVLWSVCLGVAPIPFSTEPAHLYSNLKASTLPPLTDAEMRALSAIDRGCRLIKGQVFLWKEGQDWRDLWDENGEITPA